ncbi:MAG: LamG domain-containing protein, partial [Anaerolineaceae bacterium]
MIEISSAAQLQGISTSGSYRLTADITLTSTNWTPLGSLAAPFNGTLDGSGFTIRNLTLSNTQQSNQGLFGVIGATGKVMNLRVENAFITAADNAGIVAGLNQGTISRVSAQGTITGAVAVGGLAGANSGQISNSYATATVTGQDKNGGLVGSNTGSLINTYAAGKVSKALTNTYLGFDGVDDYVSIPHNPAYVSTGSYTLEAWFNWTSADRQAVEFIVGMGLEELEIHTGGFEPIKANGIRFIPINRIDDVQNQSALAYNDAHNVLQPGWNHVAVIWDLANQQARIYLNGIPQNIFQNNVNVGTTATIPVNPAVSNPLAANMEDFYIGARNDHIYGLPGFFFHGNISDVRLWNRVRSPEEISADKNARLTGYEPGLVGYWRMDETSGPTIFDYSIYGNSGFLHTGADGTFSEAGATRVQVNGTSGGLVGSNTAPGMVANSFYDSTLYGVTDPLPFGTPLNTVDMKKQASFAVWDFDYTWDIVEGSSYPTLTDFTVTLNQAAAQADPTNASPVHFTAIFSKPINSSSFTPSDVSVSAGTCSPSVVITQLAPYDSTKFIVAVSGLTGTCMVSASIPAGTVQNAEGTVF